MIEDFLLGFPSSTLPGRPLGEAVVRVRGSLDVADGGLADGVADVVGRPGLLGVVES